MTLLTVQQVPSCQPRRLRTTTRTGEPLWPTQAHEIVGTFILRCKPIIKLLQGSRIVDAANGVRSLLVHGENDTST